MNKNNASFLIKIKEPEERKKKGNKIKGNNLKKKENVRLKFFFLSLLGDFYETNITYNFMNYVLHTITFIWKCYSALKILMEMLL